MYHSLRAARLAVALLCFLALPAWAQFFSSRPSLPDSTTFRVQVEVGDVERVRGWLAAGLSPNYIGDRVGTGLMIAAREGNVPMMELFVSRGADVNQTNKLGETALMHAAWKGQMEAVKWLLARGARVNSETMQWTALHYAVFANRSDVAALLLEKGADINARTPNGSSVLMMSVYEGHEDMARWLLSRGADTSIRNENGDGALEWAMKFDHTSIARLVSSPAAFRTAANRPKSDWGQSRRSEATTPEIEDLLRIREILTSRSMSVDKVDRRIAALRAKNALAGRKKQTPPETGVLEITAERRAPARQEVRMIIRGTPRQ